MIRWLLLGVVALCSACERSAPESAASAGVVDSIFPVEEEIRRFKTQLTGPLPTEFSPAAASADQLARQYFAALESRDTTTLRNLVLNPGEFIELYYPHSQYTRPPYKQSPAFLWFRIQQNSEKGISRALDRFGGQPAGFRTLECGPDPLVQERNRMWDCTVRWDAGPDKPDPIRLFGTIIERDGRFKFISYANDL